MNEQNTPTGEPIAIVLWWTHDTLNRWHLPPAIWRPMQVDLELAHERFEGGKASREALAAIGRIYVQLYGEDLDDEAKAPWAPYHVPGSEFNVGVKVAKLYLTGSDRS